MTGQTYGFWAHIERIVEERPATVEDFADWIGASEWAELDDHGICQIKIRRIFPEAGQIEVLVWIDPLVPGGTLMHLDADELALRMEAA